MVGKGLEKRRTAWQDDDEEEEEGEEKACKVVQKGEKRIPTPLLDRDFGVLNEFE